MIQTSSSNDVHFTMNKLIAKTCFLIGGILMAAGTWILAHLVYGAAPVPKAQSCIMMFYLFGSVSIFYGLHKFRAPHTKPLPRTPLFPKNPTKKDIVNMLIGAPLLTLFGAILLFSKSTTYQLKGVGFLLLGVVAITIALLHIFFGKIKFEKTKIQQTDAHTSGISFSTTRHTPSNRTMSRHNPFIVDKR